MFRRRPAAGAKGVQGTLQVPYTPLDTPDPPTGRDSLRSRG